MNNKEHYHQFLKLIDRLQFKEDSVLVITKIAKELATQNHTIIEKLDELKTTIEKGISHE